MRADDDARITPAPRRTGRPLLFAVAALAVIAGLAFAVRELLVSTDTRLPPIPVQPLPDVRPATAPQAAAPTPGPGTAPPAAPADDATAPTLPEPPLPALEHSDPEVRASLGDLLPPQAQPSLEPDELLRRLAVLADGFSRGKIPRDKLPLPMPGGKFAVRQSGERIYLAAGNYTRYDALVNGVAALDATATARWFRRYEPLLEEAWAELGSGGNPRAALVAGLDLLIATPDLEGEIELVQPAVFYKFADPALEALADSQKLLLRMGPGNRAVVKEQARRLREALAAP